MPGTFLVPLDGSAPAEQALLYAVRLTRAHDGHLVLVRAALAPLPTGLDWESQQLAEVYHAQTYLQGVRDRLASAGLSVETVAPYGRPAEQILKVANQVEATGIVMSSRGRTGMGHLLHGSVAESVLAGSRMPVLLVRATPAGVTSVDFEPTELRALVALDGSNFAESALPAAIDLTGRSGELILCRVVPSQVTVVDAVDGSSILAYVEQPDEATLQPVRDELDELAVRLSQEQPDLRVTVELRVGAPTQGIVEAAVDRHAALIVMTSHGRTGLSRALLGSVAGTVLRVGTVPVLVVRPAANQMAAPPRIDTADLAPLY
jgi:nucleotide-binding universal stress UspA family protein